MFRVSGFGFKAFVFRIDDQGLGLRVEAFTSAGDRHPPPKADGSGSGFTSLEFWGVAGPWSGGADHAPEAYAVKVFRAHFVFRSRFQV